jgi:hypothetical protein
MQDDSNDNQFSEFSTYGSTSSIPQSRINERRRLVRSKKSGALPSISDASRIRSRYLRRLGLERPDEERPTPPFGSKRSFSPFSVEFLKDDYGKQDESIIVGSPPVHSPFQQRKTIVSFEPSVVVHEIPSRNAYSKRVRKTIWMQQPEYNETVAKNTIEFMSEGCDPNKVLEEDDFIMHDGELVHPVYLMLGYPQLLRKCVYSS